MFATNASGVTWPNLQSIQVHEITLVTDSIPGFFLHLAMCTFAHIRMKCMYVPVTNSLATISSSYSPAANLTSYQLVPISCQPRLEPQCSCLYRDSGWQNWIDMVLPILSYWWYWNLQMIVKIVPSAAECYLRAKVLRQLLMNWLIDFCYLFCYCHCYRDCYCYYNLLPKVLRQLLLLSPNYWWIDESTFGRMIAFCWPSIQIQYFSFSSPPSTFITL